MLNNRTQPTGKKQMNRITMIKTNVHHDKTQNSLSLDFRTLKGKKTPLFILFTITLLSAGNQRQNTGCYIHGWRTIQLNLDVGIYREGAPQRNVTNPNDLTC